MSTSPQFDLTVVEATINATETTVAHGLGRTPKEAFVTRRGFSGTVYRGSTAWDDTNIYVTGSVQVLVRLIIF